MAEFSLMDLHASNPAPITSTDSKASKNTDLPAKKNSLIGYWLLAIIPVFVAIYLVLQLQPGSLKDAQEVPPLTDSSLPISTTDDKLHVKQRVLAVGDLHGDLPMAMQVMTRAGIVDGDGNWAARDAIFVQTGDIVDRGPDTIELYKLMERLSEQAALEGGRVVQLLGNHEIMNMMGDLRYVDERDTKSFGGKNARARAWSRTGHVGQYLRKLNISAIVEGSVFVHAGIHPKYSKQGFEEMIQTASKAINQDTIPYDPTITQPDCPVWYRGLVQDPEYEACPLLAKTLAHFKAERMVVGHTPQLDTGRILTRCNISLDHSPGHEPRLYVIDVGISRAYGPSGSASLEITIKENKSQTKRQVIVKGIHHDKTFKYAHLKRNKA